MAGKRKLKKGAATTLIIFGFIIAAVIIIIVSKAINGFNYSKSLDSTVISLSNNTVSGCEVDITLKDIGYYIIAVEEKGQETALIYNKNNPLEYWNLYMNEDMTSDSGYISDIAKRSVITYCIRDNIYNIEARLNGFTVDEETMSDIKYDAELEYGKRTLRAREVSGLTPEEYKALYIKEQIAHQYMLYLADQDEDSSFDAIVLKYDVGGSYYKELLEKYKYTVNDKLWENVRIGHVTVN